MAEQLVLTPHLTRAERYQELLPQIQSVLEGETDLIANLANVAAILHEGLGMLWTGFYLVHESDELVLGPFQGPLACTRIRFGKGVCGTAAATRQIQVVPDVEQFPGHIACSALSKSEVVVPMIVSGATKMVLDIDSREWADFSEVDAHYLAQVMDLLRTHHGWVEGD